jgi:acid phosphatase (class A)
MLIKFATLASAISLLAASAAWAQNPPGPVPKSTYLSEIIDLTQLIPPPPPPDSQAFKDDLFGVIEAQERRTDAQLRRAKAEKVLTIYHYSDELGPKFAAKNLPVTDAFFQRMQGDARVILMHAKNAIQRMRPFVVSKEVVPLAGTPRLPTGYPSGGTVYMHSTAILLAKMIPEKRAELYQRSSEIGLNRIMIGEHFPRDVRAGEISATVIVYALMEKPAFVRDFEAARAELRQALGYPAEPPVAAAGK